ncbi:hypothetical protein BKK79_17610 [Cupriavidus sp. USMAA2-4]|uniref:hypothetical protein n=1 Tax=Cupriavidus sp. USMAA2-4 TaxID=876364 RepID=UPI0008A69BA7|nr:hypothetical protein [Cupriavidus sp. USMAA2-4]AOY93414.1 hypothetical protein BKK79_17610 [Cupriavidus sp. USMAA2-4]
MDKAIPPLLFGFALACLWASRQIGADWVPTMFSVALIVVGAVVAAGLGHLLDSSLPFGTRVAVFPVCMWPGCLPVLNNLAEKATFHFLIPGEGSLVTYLGLGWVQFLIWLMLIAIAAVTYIRGRDSYY